MWFPVSKGNIYDDQYRPLRCGQKRTIHQPNYNKVLLRCFSIILRLKIMFISRLMEMEAAGFFRIWWKKMMAKPDRCLSYIEEQKSRILPLNFGNVSGAFYILAVGMSLSFLVFLLEVIYRRAKFYLPRHQLERSWRKYLAMILYWKISTFYLCFKSYMYLEILFLQDNK